jgi:hypothetical protein
MTAMRVRLSTKSPSQVPDVAAVLRPELPAELKNSAPEARTALTARAITSS